MTEAQREELLTLAKLVQFNIPSRLQPEQFHIVKDDVVYRLRKLARRPGAQ